MNGVNPLDCASGVILVQRQVVPSQAKPSEKFRQYAARVPHAQVLEWLLFWRQIDSILQSAA